MLNQQFFGYTFQRWISGQWILMMLLGCCTAALIILGGALMNLLGNMLVPLIMVVVAVSALVFQVVVGVKHAARKTAQEYRLFRDEIINQLPLPLYTQTQKFLLERSQTDTCLGLLVLAVRKESPERLREVLETMSKDFGYEFVSDWLAQISCTDMTIDEHEWLWTTIHAPRVVIPVEEVMK